MMEKHENKVDAAVISGIFSETCVRSVKHSTCLQPALRDCRLPHYPVAPGCARLPTATLSCCSRLCETADCHIILLLQAVRDCRLPVVCCSRQCVTADCHIILLPQAVRWTWQSVSYGGDAGLQADVTVDGEDVRCGSSG